MSENATPVAEQPQVAALPFNTDKLQSCTARFDWKTWELFQAHKTDETWLTSQAIKALITTTSPEGAIEVAGALKNEAQVTELVVKGSQIELTATFAQIQFVIKHPHTASLTGEPVA